jgi:hypothetical protein
MDMFKILDVRSNKYVVEQLDPFAKNTGCLIDGAEIAFESKAQAVGWRRRTVDRYDDEKMTDYEIHQIDGGGVATVVDKRTKIGLVGAVARIEAAGLRATIRTNDATSRLLLSAEISSGGYYGADPHVFVLVLEKEFTVAGGAELVDEKIGSYKDHQKLLTR